MTTSGAKLSLQVNKHKQAGPRGVGGQCRKNLYKEPETKSTELLQSWRHSAAIVLRATAMIGFNLLIR